MSKHLKVIVLFSLLILTQFVGCKKITELKNKGIPTVTKGNVSDNFSGSCNPKEQTTVQELTNRQTTKKPTA